MNVTERPQAMQEVHYSQKRLELALEAADLGLWDWDLKTGEMYFGSRYYEMLGYRPGELEPSFTGRRSLIHPDDVPGAEQAMFAYLEGRSPKYEAEFRIRKKDGSYMHVLSRGRIVSRDEAGRPLRVIGIQTDVTNRVRLEQQFRQAQKMEALGLLAGGIAHDFNNWLTVINGYAALLLLPNQRPEMVSAYSQMIREAGEQAAALVRRLLAFGRRQTQEPGIIHPNEVIEDLGRLIERLLPENIRFRTQLEPRLRPVAGSAGLMQQVLMNLVINARDAMPRGGTLEIQSSNVDLDATLANRHANMAPGRYVLLSVVDTGEGMDENTLEHLFEPFYTTKAPGSGSGLGLSTVYGIVRQSGGSICVNSEKGKGAIFRIYLPAAEGEKVQPPPPKRAGMPGGTETILLVEDHDDVRKFCAMMLHDLGYTVLTAADGKQAVSLARNFPALVDLLIIDSVLPDAAGGELAGQLQSIRPDSAVLFVSGYSRHAGAHGQALPSEADLLEKPFTADELAGRVRAVLRRHKQYRIVFDDDNGARAGLPPAILENAGLETVTTDDGSVALLVVRQRGASPVITDLFLPEEEGIELTAMLREHRSSPPVSAVSGAFRRQFSQAAIHSGAHLIFLKPSSIPGLVQAIARVV